MTNQEKIEYLNLLISGTITQQMVADEYGCTQQYIQRVLSGNESISDGVYEKLLKAINMVIKKQMTDLQKKSNGL